MPAGAMGCAALDATALHIRALELVLLDLYRDNHVAGTVHTSVGQEYCAACLHPHLDPSRDAFVGSHRAHGHYLAWGGDVDALLAELMGHQGAACGGRGGSQHLRAGQFFNSGIQGGGGLWGTGLAHARTLHGTGGLVVIQLGDGTLGQGAVYEAFTFAALLHAPVLFYLEWNGWAQSTDTSTTTPGDVLTRARGFGLEVHRHADADPAALHAHLGQVVARVRAGVPTLQVVDTRRLLAHSTGDDHRPPAVLESLRRTDPLSRRLAGDSALRQQFDDRRRELSDAAAAIARRPLIAMDRSDDRPASRAVPLIAGVTSNITVRDALNDALADCLEQDPRVLLIGEDLADPYGGAFKVTRGLSTRFPGRVVSTPVAEAGLVGLGIGLALAGRRPLVEIMFADFATLAADQLINHAAKFRAVYGDDVTCPLVVRLVSGGGRGFGPTHSQSLESLFLGVPGLRVVGLSSRHDVGAVMRHLVLATDGPTIVVEHKRAYGLPLRSEPPLDLHRMRPAAGDTPLAPLCFQSPHATLTIVTCGGSVEVVDDALTALFVEHEVSCDLVVLTELWPLAVTDVSASVRRTGRVLVVEEGVADYGIGAAVTAAVAQQVPVRARVVGSRPLPIPAARHLEAEVLPSSARVVAAALELL